MDYVVTNAAMRDIYTSFIEARMREESILRNSIIKSFENDLYRNGTWETYESEPWSQLPEGF